MQTQIAGNKLAFIRHRYKIASSLKSYAVYNLDSTTGGNLLTDVLRVEKFNGKSNATNIDQYLTLRTSTNWEKSQKVTGLRPSKVRGVFYGDHPTLRKSRKSLIVFVFSDDRARLTIDVYPGFYPFTRGALLNLILARYSRENQ